MRLTKQIILSLILICASSYIIAQDKQFTGSVIWKVSGNGLTENSYIFGTNHVLAKSFLSRIPELHNILDSCQQIVGEMNMNEATLNYDALKKASLMPDGKTYSQLLNKVEYNKLDSVLQEELKISLSQIESISPVSIQTMYIINLYNKISEGGGYSENMDNHFQEYARAQGKNIIALESLEQQIQYLFYSKPLQKQISELLCVISSPTITEDMKRLDQCYQNGDLIGLEKIMLEEGDCPSSPEERDIMYKDRNNNWLKVLPDIMQSKSSFIAVGCMHLAGKDGLLNRLSEMGYQIEPISMQP